MGAAQHLLKILTDNMGISLAKRWGQCRKEEAGVTLLELMAVVAILSIVAAMSVPNFIAWVDRAQLKDALLGLHGNLNLARMTAMNRNVTVTATLALVNNRVTATFTDPANTSAGCLANQSLCVIPTQVMPGQVTGFGGVSQVQFNSLGLRVGGGTTIQTIRLTNSQGVTFEIQITPAGKTRWCTVSPCP